MDKLLDGRVIAVTGAGQGIGREVALAAAAAGATVVLHGRDPEKLSAVYDEIEAAGGRQPAIIPMDFSTADSRTCENFAVAIEREFDRLDGIVHNASRHDGLTPFENQTAEQWLTLCRINLIAPFALTRAVLPLLKRAEDASIVMTLAESGHAAHAYWGGFGVTKAALEHLVKAWAQELEMWPSLRINGVIPGPVHSPQRARSHPAEDKRALPAPSSLTPAFLYFLSQQSRGISGHIAYASEFRPTRNEAPHSPL